MLKSMTLAVAALALTITGAKANDLMDEIGSMDLAAINDSAADVEELDLDALDLDELVAEAGEETDAIEACFRRIGFRRGGWGGYRGWGYGRSFHRIGYSYGHCFNRYYSCRPIYNHCYSYCRPVITSYWGCF